MLPGIARVAVLFPLHSALFTPLDSLTVLNEESMLKMKFAGALMLLATLPATARAQSVAGQQHSANIKIAGHLVGRFEDIDLDQELSRPYVYMSNGRRQGFDIVSIK